MRRRPGLSARLKLTISYAGVIVLSGALLLAVVWVFLLRYVPDNVITPGPGFFRQRGPGPPFIPNRSDLWRAFAPRAAQALAFLLLFGLVGGWLLAGRMLAPLTRIADAARLAADGSLSHRIRLEGPRDEFRELADVFDTMLERLESHITEQRRFAANASHELRTPLAISQTLLDVARNDPAWDRGELLERLQTVNTRAINLTEALLLLSRSDRRSFTREPVDLSLVAEEAAETLLPLAEKRRITLEVTGERAQTAGSAELILRMATNLVQNAIVHNLPAGGTVTVHTASQDDASVLRVENTGQVLPWDLVPTLTEPFQRGTRRVRTDEHAGVGLGLAIVHSIVRAHDGTLDLTPRPAGGLIVTIRLPRMRQEPSPAGPHRTADEPSPAAVAEGAHEPLRFTGGERVAEGGDALVHGLGQRDVLP
ncbi:MAG TPA: HAMP domain-containing sensor histidine kinase [Spirillospora sp.]|nr:HAMP domain-containing sensor histidine kinase [Spirillospora sp.]